MELFILCIFGFVILKIQERRFKLKENDLALLSLCIIITVSVILTISQNKRPWYIAPMIPFVSVIATVGISFLYRKGIVKYLIAGILMFTLVRQFIYVNTIKTDIAYFVKENKNAIQNCNELRISSDLPQNLKLYAYWFNENTIKIDENVIESDVCYLIRKRDDAQQNNCYENYCLIIPGK